MFRLPSFGVRELKQAHLALPDLQVVSLHSHQHLGLKQVLATLPISAMAFRFKASGTRRPESRALKLALCAPNSKTSNPASPYAILVYHRTEFPANLPTEPNTSAQTHNIYRFRITL